MNYVKWIKKINKDGQEIKIINEWNNNEYDQDWEIVWDYYILFITKWLTFIFSLSDNIFLLDFLENKKQKTEKWIV